MIYVSLYTFISVILIYSCWCWPSSRTQRRERHHDGHRSQVTPCGQPQGYIPGLRALTGHIQGKWKYTCFKTFVKSSRRCDQRFWWPWGWSVSVASVVMWLGTVPVSTFQHYCCDGGSGKIKHVQTTEAKPGSRENLCYSGCHHSAHTACPLSSEHLDSGRIQ